MMLNELTLDCVHMDFKGFQSIIKCVNLGGLKIINTPASDGVLEDFPCYRTELMSLYTQTVKEVGLSPKSPFFWPMVETAYWSTQGQVPFLVTEPISPETIRTDLIQENGHELFEFITSISLEGSSGVGDEIMEVLIEEPEWQTLEEIYVQQATPSTTDPSSPTPKITDATINTIIETHNLTSLLTLGFFGCEITAPAILSLLKARRRPRGAGFTTAVTNSEHSIEGLYVISTSNTFTHDLIRQMCQGWDMYNFLVNFHFPTKTQNPLSWLDSDPSGSNNLAEFIDCIQDGLKEDGIEEGSKLFEPLMNMSFGPQTTAPGPLNVWRDEPGPARVKSLCSQLDGLDINDADWTLLMGSRLLPFVNEININNNPQLTPDFITSTLVEVNPNTDLTKTLHKFTHESVTWESLTNAFGGQMKD